MVEVGDEDLAVADVAGPRGAKNGVGHGLDLIISNRDLSLSIGTNVDVNSAPR